MLTMNPYPNQKKNLTITNMTIKLKTIALYLVLFPSTGILKAQTRILVATNSIKFKSYTIPALRDVPKDNLEV